MRSEPGLSPRRRPWGAGALPPIPPARPAEPADVNLAIANALNQEVAAGHQQGGVRFAGGHRVGRL